MNTLTMDSKSLYKNIPIIDDHEESLSATEVDESLMGDEKQWQTIAKKRTYMAVLKSYSWVLNTVLLLIIIGILLLLRHEWAHHNATSRSQIGGDYSGASATFDTKIVKFEQDMRFAPMNSSEFFTNDNLALWNTMMPKGSGWTPHMGTFFTTSMTHQLHCVYMMARIFSGMVLNNTQPIPTDLLPNDWHFHFLHCVDYMRQSVMCTADLAMEPHEPDEADDTGPLDGGWNGHHVCKDYGQVTSYLEEQISDGTRVILAIDD